MAISTNGRSKTEIGYPGTKQFSGYINDEWDRRLSNRKSRLSTFREMLDDATVAALISALDALMRSTNYHVNPADDSPAAQEAAAFVEENIEGMDGSWGDQLSEINSQIVYGFSLFEIVYKLRDDGRIGWARWAPRAQETIEKWIFDNDDRDAVAVVQIAPPAYKTVTIPLDRCLHFKTRRRNQSPEGVSLIRAAFDAWYFKKHISRIESIGIERELVGLPVMKIPSDVITGEAANLQSWHDALSRLKRDEESFLIVPSDTDSDGHALYEFQLASTGGARQIDTDVVIARYERMILRSMLADFLTLGDQGVGSFALGVSRADLFAHNVQALLDSEADTINMQGIRPLCLVNGIPEAIIPRFEFDQIPSGHIGSFASALAQMVTVGVVDPTDENVRKEVYDILNIPLPEEGEQEDRPVAGAQPGVPVEEAPQQDKEAPATEPPDQESAKTFTEPLSAELLERARRAWDELADDRWRGALDAEIRETVA